MELLEVVPVHHSMAPGFQYSVLQNNYKGPAGARE